MIFAVPSDAQPASLDSWETEANGLAQGGSINVGNTILVAHPAIREIEALTWYISIGIWSIISGKPGGKGSSDCRAHGGRRM